MESQKPNLGQQISAVFIVLGLVFGGFEAWKIVNQAVDTAQDPALEPARALQLHEITTNRSGGYWKLRLSIRNGTGKPMRYYEVEVLLYDAGGSQINRGTINGLNLQPGQTEIGFTMISDPEKRGERLTWRAVAADF